MRGMLTPSAALAMLMLAKSRLPLIALFVVACSDGTPAAEQCATGNLPVSGSVATGGPGGSTGGDSLIVPDGLEVSPRPGINSVFNVTALTLKPTPNGADLYAAVRNDG